MTHLDQSCTKCLYQGPLLARFGKTLRPAQRIRRLVQRSKITEGQRAKAVTEYQAARMIRTHWASRCQSCGEETVYLMESWDEVPELYQSPNFDRASHAHLDQPALIDLEEPSWPSPLPCPNPRPRSSPMTAVCTSPVSTIRTPCSAVSPPAPTKRSSTPRTARTASTSRPCMTSSGS